MKNQLDLLINRYNQKMIQFAQRLVQTPSPSGKEGDVATLIQQEMTQFGYDRVWIDQWGNVIGLLKGENNGASIMFNGHMDHVDAGNPKDWPYPPFAGLIREGALWGRGASDMKGQLAAMIVAVGILAREEIRPPGDIYVAGVVQEEIGGLGTIKLATLIKPDLAVVGEATSNQIARGHRGRIELVATVKGQSVHASVPSRGVNPHAVLARFIQRLEKLKLATDPVFTGSTVAPTLLESDQTSSNVIPGKLTLHLDWRNIPSEQPEDVLEQLEPLLADSVKEVAGSEGTIEIKDHELHTWTGLTETMPEIFPAFSLDENHILVQKGKDILCRALGRSVDIKTWSFATDGGHLVKSGVPTIGFGPGEEHTVHTVREHVPVDMLVEGMMGYLALALELGKEVPPDGNL